MAQPAYASNVMMQLEELAGLSSRVTGGNGGGLVVVGQSASPSALHGGGSSSCTDTDERRDVLSSAGGGACDDRDRPEGASSHHESTAEGQFRLNSLSDERRSSVTTTAVCQPNSLTCTPNNSCANGGAVSKPSSMANAANGTVNTSNSTGKKGGVLDSRLWHACAGGMVQMPSVGSRVVYFPQGHAEQAATPVQFTPGQRAAIPCYVVSVDYLADHETDEVFAKITLQPELESSNSASSGILSSSSHQIVVGGGGSLGGGGGGGGMIGTTAGGLGGGGGGVGGGGNGGDRAGGGDRGGAVNSNSYRSAAASSTPAAAEEESSVVVEEQTKPMSFAKTLTQSDANNGGGFSVPRYCAETIFPALDYSLDPPVQTLVAKDVHGDTWKFRHIYRGTPRRHLLTTGWSTFVNAKKLVAGDAIVFLRSASGDLCVGVRRAMREPGSADAATWHCSYSPRIPRYAIKGGDMYSSSEGCVMGMVGVGGRRGGSTARNRARITADSVLEAVALAAQGKEFEIAYYPRASTAEFCVKDQMVQNAMGQLWQVGMRFKMAFETEDSSRISWFMGTICRKEDADRETWPGSPWRCLQVGWDDPELLQGVGKVSPWQVELVTTVPMPLPAFTAGGPKKKLRTGPGPGGGCVENGQAFIQLTGSGMPGSSTTSTTSSPSLSDLQRTSSAITVASSDSRRLSLPPVDEYYSPPRSSSGGIVPLLTGSDSLIPVSVTQQQIPPRPQAQQPILLFGTVIDNVSGLQSPHGSVVNTRLIEFPPIAKTGTRQQLDLSAATELFPLLKYINQQQHSDIGRVGTEWTFDSRSGSDCVRMSSTFQVGTATQGSMLGSTFHHSPEGSWSRDSWRKGSVMGWDSPRIEEHFFCKIFRGGEPIGRAVDLSKFSTYEQLCAELSVMYGINRDELRKQHMAYTDSDGQWVQVGDEPYRQFAGMARKAMIMSTTGDHSTILMEAGLAR